MSDLKERLARLGLSQYNQIFAAEGFDTWETILDITESDLSHLNVKLGHRRKLQRAIAESRGQSSDRPLPIALARATSAERSYRSDDSGPESKGKQGDTSAPGAAGAPSAKRKYRRHPKPDEHAPDRPPSAYVIFSNQVRESLKGLDLSFTEIAKVVGERWQVLPADERERCERQANGAKEKYYAELAEYKKTPQFEQYQKYLEDFKAKHSALTKGKRPKFETETSTSTRSSSHDQHEMAVDRRLSSAKPEALSVGPQRSNPSPSTVSTRLPIGPSSSSKPTSPATHAHSAFNSSPAGDHFLPVSTSPRSAIRSRDSGFETHVNASARDPRILIDSSLPYQPSAYNVETSYHPAFSTPSYPAYGAHYQPTEEGNARRPMRESARLPPLSHEETTLSSASSHSACSVPVAHLTGPPVPLDSIKSLRVLPQPVPSIGPSSSPLDRPSPTAPSSATQSLRSLHDHYRTQGPLAVLLRAGELAARYGDEEPMEEGSP